MTNWEAYWTRRPGSVGEGEYLRQVEMTIDSKPYPEAELRRVKTRIVEKMELGQNDTLLDICCGNGVITAELAKHCREVVGVDFSEPLLNIANRAHRPINVTYIHKNARDINSIRSKYRKQFTKVLLNAGLQYFRQREFPSLLQAILNLSTDDVVILISRIPDRNRKGNFYNTYKKKLMHIYYKIRRRDSLGTWWDEEFISKICNHMGMKCDFYFLSDSIDLPSQHYRFDIKISRGVGATGG